MRKSIAPILFIAISNQLVLNSDALPVKCLATGLTTQVSAAIAEPPRPGEWSAEERGAAALEQAEKDLGNPFVVACVAARPGDEDSSVLVYCRRKLGARTVSVFATRGEQEEGLSNGSEPAGVIRTRQALEVAGAEGADLYFLNLPDQPAGQSSEETALAWEKKDGLLNTVRFIRAVHPDVIIGGTATDDDPAKSATEQLVARAIDAAGDAGQFPEAGNVWSVKRLFSRGTQARHDAIVSVGEFDAIRGQTYVGQAEAARRAYRPAPRREKTDTIYYQLERPAQSSGTESSSSILTGLTVPKNVEEDISIPPATLTSSFSSSDRRQLGQALAGRLYGIRSGGSEEDLRAQFGADYFRVERFMHCLERAIALALGLGLEVELSDRMVIPGQKFGVKLKFINGTESQLAVEFQTPAGFPAPDSVSNKFKADLTSAEPQRSTLREYEYQTPETAQPTIPHSAHVSDSSFYPSGDGSWPASNPFGLAFPTAVRVNVGVANISVRAITTIDVAPPFEMSVTPAVALLKDFDTGRMVDFSARIINHTPGPFVGELWVVPQAVTKDDYEPISVKFTGEDSEVDIPLKLQVPQQNPPLATAILLELRRPRPARPAALVSFKIEVRVAGLAVPEDLKIGYISKVGPGVRSRLAEALQQLGCKHELITLENLRFADGNTDLKRFDSIVVDRNAYHDLPELVRLNTKLLDYVRSGGNMLVVAQRAEDWNAASTLAPLPMTLANQPAMPQMSLARITDNGSAVLIQPNKIELDDLMEWAAGRKAYLPDTWDSQYQTLIAYGPADSTPARSLLLLANVGEGTYLYLALDMDEALAGMKPGPYRFLVDLLSLSRFSTRPRRQNPAK